MMNMNKAIIVGFSPSQFETQIAPVLASLGINSIESFEDLKYGLEQLQKLNEDQSFLLLNAGTQFNSCAQNLLEIRKKNHGLRLLVSLDKCDMDDARLAVRADIDQLITGPLGQQDLTQKLKAADQFRARVFPMEKTNPLSIDFQSPIESFTENFYRTRLIGSLNDNFDLPTPKAPSGNGVFVLDADNLRVVNSIGMKLWLNWMRALAENGFTRIEFWNMRPGYMQLASFVSGFIPANGIVKSFYLQYWESETDQGFNFKFENPEGGQKILIPRSRTEKVQGVSKTLELDDSSSLILKYFKDQIEFVG